MSALGAGTWQRQRSLRRRAKEKGLKSAHLPLLHGLENLSPSPFSTWHFLDS